MKNSALRWLWTVPGKKKWYILVLAVVQALHGASGVLYALLLRTIVDAAAAKSVSGFWQGILEIVLLAAAQLALRAVIRWLTELSKSAFENLFKTRLVKTLLHRDYLQVSAVHSGEWLNRLTNDTVVVANAYVEILPGLTGMVVKLLSAVAMIISMEPLFAALLIPAGILLAFFTWLFRKALKRLHRNVQESDGRLRIFLQEHIGSLLMIRSFAAEDQTGEDAQALMEAHNRQECGESAFQICAISGSVPP